MNIVTRGYGADSLIVTQGYGTTGTPEHHRCEVLRLSSLLCRTVEVLSKYDF